MKMVIAVIALVGLIGAASLFVVLSQGEQEILPLDQTEYDLASPTINAPSPSPSAAAKKATIASPTANVCSPSAPSFRCGYVTQGAKFDPDNPPPTVCGCTKQCQPGETAILNASTGTWPDGSRKGEWTCSADLPP